MVFKINLIQNVAVKSFPVINLYSKTITDNGNLLENYLNPCHKFKQFIENKGLPGVQHDKTAVIKTTRASSYTSLTATFCIKLIFSDQV
jgi:hypothetical protein